MRARALTAKVTAKLTALTAAAVLALLAGCAQIPSTSPVVEGAVNNPDPREGIFQFIPYGPQTNAKPADLVRGFIGAAAGFSDDHRIARNFLADSRKLTWKPDGRVQVFDDYAALAITGSVGKDGTAEVTVKAPVTFRLDGDGRYSVSKPGTRVTVRYRLARNADGQWRISQLDDGILIAQDDFDATFRPFPVYFPDPSGSYLIPDVHWFAGTRDLSGSPEIPTALVRELLQGPPSWLQGAVTTGAPAGTAMALGAVVVDDEVADVDLTGNALNADPIQRRMLAGQLLATLGQLRPIASVRITVRQAEYDTSAGPRPGVGGENRSPWLQADPQVGDQALVVDGKNRLAWLTGRNAVPVQHVDGLHVPGVNHPAVSADRVTFAVLDAARQRLLMQVQGADKATVVTRGTDLSAPSFDPRGWIWTAPADNRGVVYAGHVGRGTVRVQARWLDGAQLVGLRISRDGARALVGVRSHGRGHVFMAGVLRDAYGRPTTLTQPIGMIPDLTDVADVAWVDEDQVAVLGRRAGGEQQVWLAQIGGPVTGRGGVPGALTVTAGDGESSLSVGTASGTYSYLRGWQRASGDRYPAYPG